MAISSRIGFCCCGFLVAPLKLMVGFVARWFVATNVTSNHNHITECPPILGNRDPDTCAKLPTKSVVLCSTKSVALQYTFCALGGCIVLVWLFLVCSLLCWLELSQVGLLRQLKLNSVISGQAFFGVDTPFC